MNLLELKHDRLSEPEVFLLDTFYGLDEYINDKRPDSIFYMNGDKMVFEYDSKLQQLTYSYYYIRLVIRDRFGLNYIETTDLVQSMVEEYFKLKVKTLYMTWTLVQDRDGEHFNLNVKK